MLNGERIESKYSVNKIFSLEISSALIFSYILFNLTSRICVKDWSLCKLCVVVDDHVRLLKCAHFRNIFSSFFLLCIYWYSMLIEIYSYTKMCKEKKTEKISFNKNEHHLVWILIFAWRRLVKKKDRLIFSLFIVIIICSNLRANECVVKKFDKIKSLLSHSSIINDYYNMHKMRDDTI